MSGSGSLLGFQLLLGHFCHHSSDALVQGIHLHQMQHFSMSEKRREGEREGGREERGKGCLVSKPVPLGILLVSLSLPLLPLTYSTLIPLPSEPEQRLYVSVVRSP